jgi:hypothetical protein
MVVFAVPNEFFQPARLDFPPPLTQSPTSAMSTEHLDASRQVGIHLSRETMELVYAIQQFRQRTNQSATLSAIVEESISIYYDALVNKGAIENEV